MFYYVVSLNYLGIFKTLLYIKALLNIKFQNLAYYLLISFFKLTNPKLVYQTRINKNKNFNQLKAKSFSAFNFLLNKNCIQNSFTVKNL